MQLRALWTLRRLRDLFKLPIPETGIRCRGLRSARTSILKLVLLLKCRAAILRCVFLLIVCSLFNTVLVLLDASCPRILFGGSCWRSC